MASEVTEVAAEPIEDGLTAISNSEKWLLGARMRVATLVEQYRLPDEITTERAYKDAKSSRASVRKDVAAIDAERKAMTREMDDALKRFREGVKDVLDPLTELDAAYKRLLDDYDERWAADRRAELQEAYDEYAPYLTELVSLDTLIAKFGSERGKGWMLRSTNVESAKAGVRGACDSIAQGEETVTKAVDAEDVEAAKAEYFMTLDAAHAIRVAQERAEQRERVRQLEEERKAREAEYERIRAEQEAERAEQEALEAARIAQQVVARSQAEQAQVPTPQQVPYEKPRTLTPQEAAEMWQQTTPDIPVPRPLAEHIADTMGQPDYGKVPPYVMCCYGSRADADAFREWCQQRGVKATVKPTGGSVYRIVRK